MAIERVYDIGNILPASLLDVDTILCQFSFVSVAKSYYMLLQARAKLFYIVRAAVFFSVLYYGRKFKAKISDMMVEMITSTTTTNFLAQ